MQLITKGKKEVAIEGDTSKCKKNALTVNRTRDLQIFSLTLSQLSYQGHLFRLDECGTSKDIQGTYFGLGLI